MRYMLLVVCGGLLSSCTGPAPEPVGLTGHAIFDAAEKGDLPQVRRLVGDNPAVVNSYRVFTRSRKPCITDSFPPLHLACLYGRYEVARFLIDNGADVNAAASAGWTALHEACDTQLHKDPRIVKLLIERRADVHAKWANDVFYARPLAIRPIHLASRSGRLAAVKALITAGADPAVLDSEGKNALNHAIAHKRPKVAKYLRSDLGLSPATNTTEIGLSEAGHAMEGMSAMGAGGTGLASILHLSVINTASQPSVDKKVEKVIWLYQNTTDDDLKAMPVQADVTSMRMYGTESGAAGPFITDEGLRSIGSWRHLKHLDLSGLKITDNGLQHLAGLKDLESLRLDSNKVTDNGLRHLAGLTNLQELWLDFLPITDKGAAHLKGLARLKVLRFFTAPITDKGFENFHNMLALENLQLGQALITDKSMPFIGKMTKLKMLDLRVKVTDKGIRRLSSLADLSWLALDDTAVGDEALETIAKLRKLEFLYMEGCKVTDEGLKKLVGHPGLRVLYLSRTRVTDAGAESLAALVKLRSLKLNETAISDKGLKTLQALKHLKDLEIHKTKTTPQGISELKAAIPGLTIRTHRNY